MLRSDLPQETRHRPDWRGWIILAWVLGCTFLYGRMVIEQRGGKVQAWFSGKGVGG